MNTLSICAMQCTVEVRDSFWEVFSWVPMPSAFTHLAVSLSHGSEKMVTLIEVGHKIPTLWVGVFLFFRMCFLGRM